MKISINNSKT